MFCSMCNSNLLENHALEANEIPLMTNKARILHPACSVCNNIIRFSDVSKNIKSERKVLLLTGSIGSGKTALGLFIESNSDYIFIDGDSIQTRVKYYAAQNPDMPMNYHAETISTMMILCALDYDVVVSVIINSNEVLALYKEELARHNISLIFRILNPKLSVCIDRDLARDCWTSGEEWIKTYYEEIRPFTLTHSSFCIDTSHETLMESFKNHIAKLL